VFSNLYAKPFVDVYIAQLKLIEQTTLKPSFYLQFCHSFSMNEAEHLNLRPVKRRRNLLI